MDNKNTIALSVILFLIWYHIKIFQRKKQDEKDEKDNGTNGNQSNCVKLNGECNETSKCCTGHTCYNNSCMVTYVYSDPINRDINKFSLTLDGKLLIGDTRAMVIDIPVDYSTDYPTSWWEYKDGLISYNQVILPDYNIEVKYLCYNNFYGDGTYIALTKLANATKFVITEDGKIFTADYHDGLRVSAYNNLLYCSNLGSDISKFTITEAIPCSEDACVEGKECCLPYHKCNKGKCVKCLGDVDDSNCPPDHKVVCIDGDWRCIETCSPADIIECDGCETAKCVEVSPDVWSRKCVSTYPGDTNSCPGAKCIFEYTGYTWKCPINTCEISTLPSKPIEFPYFYSKYFDPILEKYVEILVPNSEHSNLPYLTYEWDCTTSMWNYTKTCNPTYNQVCDQGISSKCGIETDYEWKCTTDFPELCGVNNNKCDVNATCEFVNYCPGFDNGVWEWICPDNLTKCATIKYYDLNMMNISINNIQYKAFTTMEGKYIYPTIDNTKGRSPDATLVLNSKTLDSADLIITGDGYGYIIKPDQVTGSEYYIYSKYNLNEDISWYVASVTPCIGGMKYVKLDGSPYDPEYAYIPSPGVITPPSSGELLFNGKCV